ncbi:MAG TPA: peptidoglycan editing factor PgeF [Bacillales bacterium]|nr:peptidoglycan editing factor PgeF [Bacillales bacterium]
MKHDPFMEYSEPALKLPFCDNEVAAGFSTRNGGISTPPFHSLNLAFHVGDDAGRVRRNRQRLATEIGFALDRWVCAEQVHEAAIRKVDGQDAGKGSQDLASAIAGTDGLYTSESGLLLALAYADCVPLYFYAPTKRLVGIAHAGWRGTVKMIAARMVKAWKNVEGVSVQDILVVIGPSIGACCYEVDTRVAAAVNERLGTDAKVVCRPTGNDRYHLDLKACNQMLLVREGVSEHHIETSSYCTSCRTDKFYSHRKENGKTGRMLAFIGMRSAAVDRRRGGDC